MIPLYQAEICHPSIRGRVTALQQFMLGVGALCATWIGYGTYTGIAPDNHAQWQVPLGIQIAPAVFLGLLISFFPEVSLCENCEKKPPTNLFSRPVGLLTTTVPRRVCVHWPSCMLMVMRTTLGCRLNMLRSRKASRLNMKTRQSRISSCSPTALRSVDYSFAVLCKLLSR